MVKKGKIDRKADREFKNKHKKTIQNSVGGGWGPEHEKLLHRLRQREGKKKSSLKIKDD